MATKIIIRHRLLTIALLGVVTSSLSLVALVRALSSMSRTMRMERARESVGEELGRLARSVPSAETLATPPSSNFVGLRAGWLRDPLDVATLASLPSSWRAPLADAVASSAVSRSRVIVENQLDAPSGLSTLVVAVEPTQQGGFAWTAYPVFPATYLQLWRWIAGALALATLLLAGTLVWGAFSWRRSTRALDATLRALGKDLAATVPQPTATEFVEIADGIRRMASELLASREATERLGRELGQKERLAALGRVVAGVAHEVRNPLASIKLRLDLTAASGALPDAAKRAVDAASQEITRLDRLVSDLLLVAGQKMGPRRTIDLGVLLRERAEALGPWAAERNVAVHAAGAGVADADPESVARALDNVLRNAVEASQPGEAIEANVAVREGAVEVRVEDHGEGVDPARASELFEPFFTTKSEGTGLGLAISRAIARAHGGDLVYARRDEVTSFSLSLPHSTAALSLA